MLFNNLISIPKHYIFYTKKNSLASRRRVITEASKQQMRNETNGTHIGSEYATIQLETIQNTELNFLPH